MIYTSTIDGVPAMLIERWKYAHAVPTIARWRALSQLCASQAMLDFVAGKIEQHDDLALLADVAHRHGLMMQPIRWEAAA
jgi:hypothetical protein